MAAPALPLLGAWGRPGDADGYSSSSSSSSSSSAASPDSCGRSPPYAARGPRHGPGSGSSSGPGPGRKGARGPVGGQRQSASEREKLRMRQLARALHTLRRYLPPALAPAGQSLTKVETLRLAARYIGHLSALLGLGEEGPARRRGAAARRCPLCPPGLGCCRPPPPCGPAAGTPAGLDGAPGVGTGAWASPPCGRAAGTPAGLDGAPGVGTGPWASPPCGPAAGTPVGLDGAPGVGTGAWASPPCSPVAETPVGLDGAPGVGTGAWASLPCGPMAGTPPGLDGALVVDVSSWLSPPHCAGAGSPPEPPRDPLLEAGLTLPEFADAGMVTQDLSADLLSLLEALLPLQPQD
ncbi:mesoderm posterior protein 1-like [Struthio camelus]|uniref:mesoderm posterior protein 1-like n=1 Tax=Struthio camelus TaxID=8801 RepID=UPI0036042A8D